jgi:hypothetical protein
MSKFILSIENLALSSRAVIACAALGCAFLGCSDSDDDASEDSTTESNQPGRPELSFFVTSTTHDGNLGGLAGADEICNDLADAAGSDKTFAAYLSAENEGNAINARERIGDGPWYNAAGMMLAMNLADLYRPTLVGNSDLFITEKGEKINGQWNSSNGMNGAPANEHDIMTGSDSNGMLLMNMVTTCADWTSNTLTPGPQVGHTDGMGPGMDTSMPNFTSWSGGHAAAGCSTADLAARGGAGRFYCFATN